MSSRSLLYTSILGSLTLVFFFSSHEYVSEKVILSDEIPLHSVNKQEIQSATTTLLVFGDVMLDRYIRTYIDTHSTQKLFEFVQKDITDADITLINLEGPITKNASVVTRDNLQFTFATKTAKDLYDIGIDVVSLANNHTHNFGKKGIEETISNLNNAQITYFGSPYNEVASLSKEYTSKNLKVSFVGYHQFENPDFEVVTRSIQNEKNKGNFVIFYPHWGNEYELVASSFQKNTAQQALDAGADIVLGAHPHVIQNLEIQDQKYIFYSLGNFIFDQWFSKDVQNGLALLLTFKDTSLVSIELKPFFRERYQPKWLENEEKTEWCQTYTKTIVNIKVKPENPCILITK